MKKPILALVLCLMTELALFANIAAVDLSKLPQDSLFKNKIGKVLENVQFLDHYSPTWEYPITKIELAKYLHAAILEIEKRRAQKGHDIELGLLEMVLFAYEYNLDVPNSNESIKHLASDLKTEFPDDYRPYWILGLHLARSSRVVEGNDEFDAAIGKLPDLRDFPSAFLDDYAWCCMLGGRLSTALHAWTIAASMEHLKVENFRPAAAIAGLFRDVPPDTKLNASEVWDLYSSRGQYVLSNRPLGVTIPVNPSWKAQRFDLKDRESGTLRRIGGVPGKSGKRIGITIMYLLSGKDDTIDSFIQTTLGELPVVAEETRTIGGRIYRLYRYEDKHKYQEIGGSVGYLAFAEIPNSSDNAALIEKTHDPIKQGSGGTSYQPLKTQYNRYNHSIHVCIMLDTCNDALSASEQIYFSQLDATIFD